VLEQSVKQLAEWRAKGHDVWLSVNLSSKELHNSDYAAQVADVLAEYGVPPQRLVLEVTEHAVATDMEELVRRLAELRGTGVRIALDDFGTGHSSLGLLHTVPVDVLKVDKSFVDNVTEAGRHAVIARALIQVTDGLGLTAVAEGVETAEQAEALYDLGYRLLQGYHFGRPAAAPEFRTSAQALDA
jgi:EAL domain-containing protein (putative c-di-GMP-specific phosphodiesterase class I)